MKLPEFFQKIIDGKPKQSELYLSLVLEPDYVAGACWYIYGKNNPKLLHAVIRRTPQDSWEDRILASDQVITTLEQKTESDSIYKVIFGLPAIYLTPDGEILPEIRTHLKKLTEELTLKPIGFVPVHQAIVYKLRHEEGIPPSIILIGVAANRLVISLYKVGKLIHQQIIDSNKHNEWIMEVVDVLKNMTDIEIFPSRILLYGVEKHLLDELQTQCLSFHWTVKGNFLHLPKIETLPLDMVVRSVSLAGASELSKSIPTDTDEKIEKPQGNIESEKNINIEDTPKEETIENSSVIVNEKEEEQSEIKAETEEKINNNQEDDEMNDEQFIKSNDDNTENTTDSSGKGEEVLATESDQSESEKSVELNTKPDEVETDQEKYAIGQKTNLTHSNVAMVNPEELGFKSNADILSSKQQIEKTKGTNINETLKKTVENKPKEPPKTAPKPKKDYSKILKEISHNLSFIPYLFKGKLTIPIIVVSILIMIAIGFYLVTSVFPMALINISLNQKKAEVKEILTVDPQISAIDNNKFIIPGKKLEQSITGDDNINVTGTKTIGDPAKGTVVIYNKTISTKQFKKGAVLEVNNLTFTLDNDTEVASASESIGSITFGKTTANITAVEIGTKSNLDGNTEFTFKNTPSSSIVARNDKALSGGTSRSITVVSRADYDALVSKVTKNLTEKAKQQLSTTVGGGQILINETISTAVKDKKFSAELGQEVKSITGTVTVAVSGIAIEKKDLIALYEGKIKEQTGSKYDINSDSYVFNPENVKVKKDNTITITMKTQASLVPIIDIDNIKKSISGKKIQEANDYLKSIEGISEVKISFKNALFKSAIPKNINKIQININK